VKGSFPTFTVETTLSAEANPVDTIRRRITAAAAGLATGASGTVSVKPALDKASAAQLTLWPDLTSPVDM